ncbi:MAG: antitoxin AF2212-like protein [Candidatus Altiarchaeota archaeon]|nr:antitoxin AF2212-like protein [Candidatus Altiarchaeota archaeon]
MEVVCVYRKGVLKPLKKLKMREGKRVRMELKESVVESTFGLLKAEGRDVEKAIEEVENEWGA